MVNLPSKKAQSFIVLIVGIMITVIIVFGQNKVKSGVQNINTLFVGDKISLPENPNWQEDLGVVSVSGNFSDLSQIENASSTNKETLTDTVSRSLMSNYLVLKQNNELDPTTAQNLISQTLGYLDSAGIQKIDSSSLKIIPDNGTKTMTEYGDRIGNILLSNKPKNTKNELQIIQNAVENRDPSKISELAQIASVYAKIAEDFKSMPVPIKFQKIHVEMTNNLLAMSASINEMSKVFEDPMRGLTGMQAYQASGTAYIKAIQTLGLFLTQNKISYKQGSGGYYLLYGI